MLSCVPVSSLHSLQWKGSEALAAATTSVPPRARHGFCPACLRSSPTFAPRLDLVNFVRAPRQAYLNLDLSHRPRIFRGCACSTFLNGFFAALDDVYEDEAQW